jgi:peptidoglycan/LPS O-acetylase OafA/YrhL
VGAVVLFSVFNYPTTKYSSLPNIAELFREFLTGLALGVGILPFVVLIVQLYLFYPLLVKIYNRAARYKRALFLCLLLLLAQIAYSILFVPIGLATNTYERIVRIFFVSAIFYFIFGFFVSEHYGAIKQRLAKLSLKSISLAALVSTMYYTVVYYHVVLLPGPTPLYYLCLYWLTGPLYCLILIVFYLKLSTGWAEPRGYFLRSLEKIGEDSFGIYLVHYFFIGTFSFALVKLGLGPNNLLFYPVLFSLTLTASYLSVEGIYRLPLSAIIIGRPRKKRDTDIRRT